MNTCQIINTTHKTTVSQADMHENKSVIRPAVVTMQHDLIFIYFIQCSGCMSHKFFYIKILLFQPCDSENFQKVSGNTNIFFSVPKWGAECSVYNI